MRIAILVFGVLLIVFSLGGALSLRLESGPQPPSTLEASFAAAQSPRITLLPATPVPKTTATALPSPTSTPLPTNTPAALASLTRTPLAFHTGAAPSVTAVAAVNDPCDVPLAAGAPGPQAPHVQVANPGPWPVELRLYLTRTSLDQCGYRIFRLAPGQVIDAGGVKVGCYFALALSSASATPVPNAFGNFCIPEGSDGWMIAAANGTVGLTNILGRNPAGILAPTSTRVPVQTATPSLADGTTAISTHTATLQIALSTPTPEPSRVIEAQWPSKITFGSSETIRVSIIDLVGGSSTPASQPGSSTLAVATPRSIGTPGAGLGPAFGGGYEAFVSAHLNASGLDVVLTSDETQPLDLPRHDWVWSIAPKNANAGTIIVNLSIDVEWRPTDGTSTPIRREVWRSAPRLQVTQPFVTLGQVSLASILGGGMTLTWFLDRLKASGKKSAQGEETKRSALKRG
jgi:hypothetical protein